MLQKIGMLRFLIVLCSGILLFHTPVCAKSYTLGSVQEVADEKKQPLTLTAKAAVLMDGENGRILYAKCADEVMANASTTKILTAIVVLEHCDLREKVCVSKHAAARPKVRLGIREGEQYYVEDLLYAMLLKSCNDCASALAEHVAGSEEAFSKLLNEKADAIGCRQTFFITPNGLDAKKDGKIHGTSAKDLALMTRYALSNETFCDIIRTRSHTFSDVAGKRTHTVSNTNRFLQMDEDAIGVKTGYTSQAGYCFVGACRSEERLFISVVLGSGWPPHKNEKWNDTQKLMSYGKEQFTMRELYQELHLKPFAVMDGVVSEVPICQSKKSMRLLLSDEDDVTRKVTYFAEHDAPVLKGQVVGKVSYYVNDILYDETELYTLLASEKYDYFYCLKKVIANYLMTNEKQNG